MKPQILGLAFASPLIIQMLFPPQQYQRVLLLSDVPKDLRGAVDLALKQQGQKQLVVLAGSLEICQAFLKQYPDLQFKLVLFDFPGLVQPLHSTMDPLIRWLDCDHQAGGAWQTCKMKLDSFVGHLDKVDRFGPEGAALVGSMQRFVPRDRLGQIEAIAEHLPEHYKALIATEATVEKEPPAWERELGCFTLKGVIDHFGEPLADDAKAEVAGQAVDFLLKRVNRRDFNAVVLRLAKDDKELKRRGQTLKRWLEHAELGGRLFLTYLDYLVNYPARSWHIILQDGYGRDPDDVLLLLTRQPKTDVVPKGYAADVKKVAKLPKPDQAEVSIHPQPLPWNEIFKT